MVLQQRSVEMESWYEQPFTSVQARPARAVWKCEMVRFLRHKPLGALGGLIIVGMVFLAFFAPWLAPYDPYELRVDDLLTSPNPAFLQGTNDDYTHSALGLQEDKSWAAGFDVSWSPIERLAFFASYLREDFDARMRSRYREPPAQLENPTFDWVAKNNDVVHTLGAGIDTTLVPKKLDLRLAWNYSRATGKMRAFNPVSPSGGTAAQNASAAAVTFPEISDRLQQLEASLRYRFTPALFARLRYMYETFDITDFRTDTIQPFMGGTDIFLGAQVRDYTAHILAVSIGYRF